ncbi:MAG: hypothetical protein AABW73_03935 [Nanoarchaeota archaeon]
MITFSSDSNDALSIKDQDSARSLIKEYFNTAADPYQAQTHPGKDSWSSKNAPELFNIIKSDGVVIGCVNMFPCSLELMERFCNNFITESELLELIKSSRISYDSVYMCVAVIKGPFRGKGLALKASISSLRKFMVRTNEKPVLFYWKFSESGGQLAQKVSNTLGLVINKRE